MNRIDPQSIRYFLNILVDFKPGEVSVRGFNSRAPGTRR
jgi:hypothetical protein